MSTRLKTWKAVLLQFSTFLLLSKTTFLPPASSRSDVDCDGARGDSDPKPTVPVLGVLSAVLKGDETHSRPVVGERVADLQVKRTETEKHSVILVKP